MKAPIAYGIDFGTSNSTVAAATPSGIKSLGKLTSPGIPSLLYVDQTRQTLIGDKAAEQFLIVGGWPRARLMSSVKSFLADDLIDSTESWGIRWSKSELVGHILRLLKAQADESCGHDVRRLVLGHPVVFAGAEGARFEDLQQLALSRLEEAAALAGFEEVVLLDEPTAALQGSRPQRGVTVALDFGAGTFDVSIMDIQRRSRDVLATQGVAVGGDHFDGYVFDLTLRHGLGLDTLRSGHQLQSVRTMTEMLSLAGQPNTLTTAVEEAARAGARSPLRLIVRILEEGQAYAMSRAVEDAKIELSDHQTATVELIRTASGIRITEPVDRSAFEHLIRPELDQVMAQVEEALGDAQITAQEVDHVVLTGGSCLIPDFRKRVAHMFPQQTIIEADVSSAVVEGLAAHAREIDWR